MESKVILQTVCRTPINNLAIHEFPYLAQWIERPPSVRKVIGSIPVGDQIFSLSHSRVMLISSLFTYYSFLPPVLIMESVLFQSGEIPKLAKPWTEASKLAKQTSKYQHWAYISPQIQVFDRPFKIIIVQLCPAYNVCK